MTEWKQHDIHAKITKILSKVSCDHHFGGRPYSAPYQIAAAFVEHYPNETTALGYPIGGTGTGAPMTLAKYFANMLSRGIKEGTITNIEGAFLSNQHLNDILFHTAQGVVASTLTRGRSPLSIFRLKNV